MDIEEIIADIKDTFYTRDKLRNEIFRKSTGFRIVLASVGIQIDSFGSVSAIDNTFINLLKQDPDIDTFKQELLAAVKDNLVSETTKKSMLNKLRKEILDNLKYKVHVELVDTLSEELKEKLVKDLIEEFNNSIEYKALKLEMSLNDSKN